jgi:uncharacterized protein (TIGR00255 family)
MTGYARSQGQDGIYAWTWELKSVNGRGLELRARLPAGYDFLDLPVREMVQKRFRRGSITISLNVTELRGSASLNVNEAALAQYVALARRWRETAPELAPTSLEGLLALRGVLDTGQGPEDAAALEARGAAMMATLDLAVEALAVMRAAEGSRLAQVLDRLLSEIGRLTIEAEGTASLDPAAIKERLRQQVAALIDAVPTLSEDRLLQEAALIAAKADVREELDRLKAHLAAAREMLAANDPVGRKLDFLCQEFNREANTLCSKANDIALTRIGLALKTVIEQFREQVQNIE